MKTSGVISLLFVCLVYLAGCGGSSSNSSPASVASLSKVDAKISLAALSASVPAIAGIEATITFPEGVTVQTTPNDLHQAADGVVELTPQPANHIRFARYSSATATTPGKLKFTVLDANGFNASQEIVLNFGITPGFFPLASQFGIVNYQFRDINGALLAITPTLDIKFQ